MSVKQPIPTALVPNPLHNFASYTYALSLWWLDTDDYNGLANCTNVKDAMDYKLTKSYVLAEDSGLYPDQRLPGTGGLNYYLSDVDILTHVQPATERGQTNDLSCKFKITEPYGSTLLDVLIMYGLERGVNYIDQPFLLQVEFFGYDDQGNQIPKSQTEIYRKRYPIKISGMKVHIGIEGSTYQCTGVPQSFEAYSSVNCKLPRQINVTGATFKEVLDELAKEYNKYYATEVALGHRQFASTLKFDIDKDIQDSKVTNPKTMPLSQVAPSSQDSALGKAPFIFTAGEDINDIIQRLFAQCSFWADDQLGIYQVKPDANLGTIVNTYKTTVQSLVQGVDGGGGVSTGAAATDISRGKFCYAFTYRIHQHATFGGRHTIDPGQFSDARRFVTKLYNYTYTGQNTDILKLDINLNLAYYTAVIAYANQSGAAQVTAESKKQNQAEYVASSGFALTPSFLINTILPQLKKTRVIAPTRIETIVSDMSIQQGLRGQSKSIVAMDVLKSKQQKTDADMLVIKLDIVGDPTLMKQDDWLYSPSPNDSTDYNNWHTLSQAEFAKKYGHLRMDVMPVVIGIQINTPIDADNEYLNTGLMFPPMTRNGTSSSVFSGLYTTTTINNVFSKGTFTQTINCVRIDNQEYNADSEPVTNGSAASTSQDNQRESTETNKTTNKVITPTKPVIVTPVVPQTLPSIVTGRDNPLATPGGMDFTAGNF